jgi:uncharacterized membrane protein
MSTWKITAAMISWRKLAPVANEHRTMNRVSRLCGLDALRGLAVFLMIEQHMGVWLWEGMKKGVEGVTVAPLVAFNALGGGAAPMFITLAGVGVSLMARSERAGLDLVLVRRGLVLLGFGYLLSAITPSWFSWGSWFVLHLMGAAMASAPLWRRLPDRALLVLALAIACAAIAAQVWLDTPLMIDNKQMRDVSRPGGALRLALFEGQFPVFPWLGPFLVGMVAGRWIIARRFAAIAGAGLAALALGGLGALVWLLAPALAADPMWERALGLRLGFFPASISIVALLLGAVLLVIAAVAKRDDARPIGERNPMVVLGRASLTLLLLHVPLFREATRPVGLWHGVDATGTLLMIAGFVALSIAFAYAWQRIDYRGGAEWLLRRVGG